MTQIRIYVENKSAQPEIYRITDDLVRSALPDNLKQTHVDICSAERPDMDLLAQASHFIGFGFDPARIRSRAPRVRVVHAMSAGVERYLPLDWLPDGAVLTNSSGAQADKGGAYGAMALLMLNELIPHHATSQRNARWDRTPATAIAGKVAMVYGFGELGASVARRIRPFDVKVIGVRRSGASHPDADDMVRPAAFREWLPRVDFLVLSCPLTHETRGLVGLDEISLLPRGAGILNIARGPVLDNDALAEALRSGHLSGAILDVFDPEPLPAASPLWDVPNLMLTPHTSCDDARGDVHQCLAIFGDNIARELAGRPLRNVVNASDGY